MNEKRREEITRVMDVYGGCLYRTACVMLGKPEDAQDILQETLIKYMEKAPAFKSEEHEKAWLLKVTGNLCRDFLRFNRRHRHLSLEQAAEICAEQEDQEIIKEVILLPAKYKIVLLLFYVEGYQAKEIAHMIGITESAVKKRLQRGRELLRRRIDQ